MFAGALFALAAGLMWGLAFVAPAMLEEYPAPLLSFGRYLAFGVIVLPIAWLDRQQLRALTRADWTVALELSLIGNLLYYICLASAVQRAGAPLPTMIVGTIPVVIAIVSNRHDARRGAHLAWRRLAPSLVLIALGIALVNHTELAELRRAPGADLERYALGAALSLGALACWTWYPLRNAEWLRARPDRQPRTWATAQGLTTLPLAVIGYLAFWAWSSATSSPIVMPFGPQPVRYVGLMLAIGLLASWLGTMCWNEASQRLPTRLAGQLIVFETLAALAYAFVLRGRVPGVTTLAGVALLIAGVIWALRTRPDDPALDASAPTP
jgi:drug/metabolite transporter (DMT)-like permease